MALPPMLRPNKPTHTHRPIHASIPTIASSAIPTLSMSPSSGVTKTLLTTSCSDISHGATAKKNAQVHYLSFVCLLEAAVATPRSPFAFDR